MSRVDQPDMFLRRSSRSHHGRLAGGDLSVGTDIGPGSALGGEEGGGRGAAAVRSVRIAFCLRRIASCAVSLPSSRSGPSVGCPVAASLALCSVSSLIRSSIW